MESRYIDLVINRLTQAQYDELKRTNQISEEELYEIIDHDDLFYYKTELYTKSEIENKLASVLRTLRDENTEADALLDAKIESNKTQIESTRADLVTTNNTLSSFKTTVESTYATKVELSEYSPVEANPDISGGETVLKSITIDGDDYRVYPEGEIEFDTVRSTSSSALTLGSIKIGTDIWNLPVSSGSSSGNVDLSDYYTKSEVNTIIDSIDITDKLSDYALKSQIPTKLSQLTNDSGYLTEHQSLIGYARETYVDQKISELVNSSPEALNTLHELAQALGNDPNFATTITNELSLKANSADVYTKDQVDEAISNVDVSGQLQDFYTKEEIDSMDFTNVTANPETTGTEIPLTTISIKGVNYFVSTDDADTALILSDTPVDGASNLASITINGDSWNIVGSGGGGGSLNPEDLADYYTKSEVNSKISSEVSKLIGAAPSAYDTLKEIADYIESDLTNTSAMLADIAKKANSSEVYSKSEANGKFALKTDIPEAPNLSNYYTKEETLGVIDKISGLDNYYEKGEVDSKLETINASKQDTLISGSNIKTINGVSIMGAGNILINEGSSGGTSVQANPPLNGDELELTSIAIDNINYTIPAGDMVFSESVVQDQKTLKTIMIDGDIWSIEKGSTLIANPPLTGNEDPLESVQIDDTVFTLKGEEMLFFENELEGAVPLKTIVINGDPWYVGGLSEEKVDLKINNRLASLVNSAPETLDTLGELATALQNNSSIIEVLNETVANKANKNEIIKSYNDLTDKPDIPNIVFSESEPTNPVTGMIWLKPVS